MVNIMWDFNQYGLRIPAAGSRQEAALFTYLDTLLAKLLPAADIIVAGNEPFINTLPEDWQRSMVNVNAPIPIVEFYKRVAEHINNYMVSKGVRSKHKIYMGAFTHVYGSAMQNEPAVLQLLDFARTTDYIDGVDIHTHVKTMDEMKESFDFISAHVPNKPITDTEYTYVFSQALHINDLLSLNDTKPFAGNHSFLEKYANATATKQIRGVKWINDVRYPVTVALGQRKYTATTTINDYMAMALVDPVPQSEWNDLMRSRSWTIDHYIASSNALFKHYNVNGATFGLTQGEEPNLRNGTPWYMNGLYVPALVQLMGGLPAGNYQYLTDFQKLNGLPQTN